MAARAGEVVEIRLPELDAKRNGGPSQTTEHCAFQPQEPRTRIGTQIDQNASVYFSQDVPSYHEDDEAYAA
ncbi:hypothetical protein LSUE1_G000119 [Lachnellula suecica]|uniref:Uncharacterized protein n=1 Tax=Lachnellula suecica TaxID=602035 RepID=A0A8T9CHC6_9HELO|nr:hypothetical protein LSUE1_G000119 [Lachnellula suecica]